MCPCVSEDMMVHVAVGFPTLCVQKVDLCLKSKFYINAVYIEYSGEAFECAGIT
jgi:hypothetical protein